MDSLSRDTKNFLSQNTTSWGKLIDIVPPECPGLSPGSHLDGTCLPPDAYTRRALEKLSELPQLTPLNVERAALLQALPDGWAPQTISQCVYSSPVKDCFHQGRCYNQVEEVLKVFHQCPHSLCVLCALNSEKLFFSSCVPAQICLCMSLALCLRLLPTLVVLPGSSWSLNNICALRCPLLLVKCHLESIIK